MFRNVLGKVHVAAMETASFVATLTWCTVGYRSQTRGQVYDRLVRLAEQVIGYAHLPGTKPIVIKQLQQVVEKIKDLRREAGWTVMDYEMNCYELEKEVLDEDNLRHLIARDFERSRGVPPP